MLQINNLTCAKIDKNSTSIRHKPFQFGTDDLLLYSSFTNPPVRSPVPPPPSCWMSLSPFEFQLKGVCMRDVYVKEVERRNWTPPESIEGEIMNNTTIDVHDWTGEVFGFNPSKDLIAFIQQLQNHQTYADESGDTVPFVIEHLESSFINNEKTVTRHMLSGEQDPPLKTMVLEFAPRTKSKIKEHEAYIKMRTEYKEL